MRELELLSKFLRKKKLKMDKLRKPMQADELDMDVMAEAELKRLQRQVSARKKL